MDDLISVVIPVYNGAQYLEKCLGSLLAQSYQHWEAILVDDSSTDNSFEVLQEFARRDSRFHAYRKANQRFACHGIRYGVEHAKGKWFCYMSQDDRLSPDYLEQTLAAARSAGAEIALGRLVHFYDDVEEPFEMPVSEGDVISGREAFELSLDWRIHEYDTRRQFFSACKVVVSGSTFYYHVGNPQSITRKWDVAQLDYITVAHKLRLFARDNGVEHQGNVDSLLRTLSAGACLRSARMAYSAYRSGEATKSDIRRLMDAIRQSRPEWQGRSKALTIGTALYPLTGPRPALTAIIKILTLRGQA